MAVVVDNTGQGAGATSTTTVTIASFAVGAGANRCIYLAVSQWKASDLQPTVAWDPTGTNLAFTAHDNVTVAEAPGTRRVTLFKLVNPPNATKNIVVTWSVAVDEAVAGATSWTGVDQTTPFGTAVKNSGSATAPITSSVVVPNASGDVVHDAISVDSAGVANGTANQTLRWNAIAGGNTTEGAGQSAAGAGSNITSTWTSIGLVSGTSVFAHIGVAIQQSSGAAAVVLAPLVPGPMRPTPKGIIGKVALAMRVLRPPSDSGPTPSTVSSAGASVSHSMAYAMGVAIIAAAGTSLSHSPANAAGTSTAAGAGVSLSHSPASTPGVSFAAGAGTSLSHSPAAAAGTSTVANAGTSLSQSTAAAPGTSTVANPGSSLSVSVASALGSTFTAGVFGTSLSHSMAFAPGTSTVTAGGASLSHSPARAPSASTVSLSGTSLSHSPATTPGGLVVSRAGVSLSHSRTFSLGGLAGVFTVEAAGLELIPNNGTLSLAPNSGLLSLSPNDGTLALVPNNGTLLLIPDL